MAIKCPTCHSDNPETQRFCGTCGTQLPPPQERAPVMTETLETPGHDLARGTTIAGRYEVIEELGRGGMGKVYRVEDKKIKAEIALKLIKPEISSDKKTIERFSNELKTTRMISHRNVCRMFDLGEEKGTYFITMEYVAGQDLRGLIRQTGQLTVGKAIAIAKQISEGLAEAHRLGVVHRDLKPSNIIIDKDGNARIMDFGIARSLYGKSLTGEGVIIGTPEYMSPEQVEGKEADQRSDIYSLGVILYEMLTGRAPFEGDTPLSVAVKHKTEKPKDPKELNEQIPDDLDRLILRCLEKDKDRRYQSAEDVRSELEKIEKGLPTTTHEFPGRKPVTSREITLKFTPRKFLVPGLALLGLIAVAIVVWRVLPSKKPVLAPSTSGQPTLAVLNFENKSADSKLDYLREELSELLITDLSQSKYVRVISGEEMFTVLKKLGLSDARRYSSEDIDKIAAQVRATHVLRGSFIKAGEGFVITAGLQKPGMSGSSNALRLEAANDRDIIAKVDELTRQVKEGLNLTSNQIAGDVEKEAGTITTSSPEALRYYIEGRKLHNETKYEQAIASFEKAVEIDPEFAMAYRALAVSHRNLGHPDWRKYLDKALALSARLPDNERLLIEGESSLCDNDDRKAAETLERLVAAYPGYSVAHGYLATIYMRMRDFDKAIRHQELAVQISRTAITVSSLASFYNAKGLYQKAEDVCRSFIQDVEDNDFVRCELRDSYLNQRKFDLALTEAEKLSLLHPGDAGYKESIGDVLLIQGDIGGAEKIYQQMYQKDPFDGGRALYKLALVRGKYTEALRLNQQSLDYYKQRKDTGGMIDSLGRLIDILEKCGRIEDAKKFFVEQLQIIVEARKSQIKAGSPYRAEEQEDYLYGKGLMQARLGLFDEARKTAEEYKAIVDMGIGSRELGAYEEYDYEMILGLIELGEKNYSQAAELFKKAYGTLSSDAARVRFLSDISYFARALYESGDLDGARQNYEKIKVAVTPTEGDIYAKAFYMLGKIAEQQEDKVKARENYQKFLDLWKDADPGLPEVPDAKARLAGLK